MQNTPSTDSSVRYLTISTDQAGQRIDNFLMALARSVPKSHIYRIIRTGQVRINGGRIKPTQRIQAGDSIRVPPMVRAEPAKVSVPDRLVSELEDAVIHEDDELIVINKPPGIAVHAGSGVHFGVIDAFRQSRSDLSTRLELIHRLDRGTSGCLMIGKSRQSTLKFQEVFRQREIAKHYTALLCGQWPHDIIRVDLPLSKNVEQGGQRMVKVDPAGKEAVSHFSLIEVLGQGAVAASLVNIRIETGRTHQIRVHAAEQGHPVIGDDRYCSTAIAKPFRRAGLKRLYLHCSSLVITTGACLSVKAAPDAAWSESLQALRGLG